MPRYHGGKAIVQASVGQAGSVSQVISMSKWSLNKSRDLNKVYVQGLPDIKGTLSGFWDSSSDVLFNAADSPDGVKLYLYPSSLYPTSYEYGPAWLDQTIDVDVKGAVSMTGAFVAAGAWGHSH
jgi:hypothetical protein